MTRKRSRARACVVWGVVVYAAVQLALVGTPSLRDPEYGRRLAHLRDRQREHPGRPLVLLLGSSRVACGVDPDAMAVNHAADGPLVFNSAWPRVGPLEELITLRRLFADGVRPRVVVVEAHCVFYRYDSVYDTPSSLRRYGWADVDVLKRYLGEPDELERYRVSSHLAPAYQWRLTLLADHAPWVLAADDPLRAIANEWRSVTPWGWLRHPKFEVPDADRVNTPARVAEKRAAYLPYYENGVMTERSKAAYREMKEVCDRHGCRMVLLHMPDILVNDLTDASRGRLDAELTELGESLGVPLMDFRRWGAVGDYYEGIHLSHAGAGRFAADFEPHLLRVVADPTGQTGAEWPGPLTVRWGKGFSIEETSDIPGWRRYRWCAAEGTMTVGNDRPTPRRVTLAFSPQANSGEPCNFTVDGPGLSETFKITAGPTEVRRTIDLPFGVSTFRFKCDGPATVYPTRTIVFALHEFTLTPADGG